MKLNTLFASVAFLAISIFVLPSSASAQSVNDRYHHQNDRAERREKRERAAERREIRSERREEIRRREERFRNREDRGRRSNGERLGKSERERLDRFEHKVREIHHERYN